MRGGGTEKGRGRQRGRDATASSTRGNQGKIHLLTPAFSQQPAGQVHRNYFSFTLPMFTTSTPSFLVQPWLPLPPCGDLIIVGRAVIKWGLWCLRSADLWEGSTGQLTSPWWITLLSLSLSLFSLSPLSLSLSSLFLLFSVSLSMPTCQGPGLKVYMFLCCRTYWAIVFHVICILWRWTLTKLAYNEYLCWLYDVHNEGNISTIYRGQHLRLKSIFYSSVIHLFIFLYIWKNLIMSGKTYHELRAVKW